MLQNKELFKENIEAWVHGPAIRSVYLEYKRFGFEPIAKRIGQQNLNRIPKDIQDFLNQVWAVYGKYDAAYLEHLTHSEDPWQKAREGIEPHVGSENIISLKSMRVFYSSKLEQSKAA